MRSPITTHILDTAMGRPASEVSVVLSQKKNTGWEENAIKRKLASNYFYYH